MDNNQWPVYEHIKKHWRKTGKIQTFAEVRQHFPNSTQYALSEGMIEFAIAFKGSLRHEENFIPDDEVLRRIEEMASLA